VRQPKPEDLADAVLVFDKHGSREFWSLSVEEPKKVSDFQRLLEFSVINPQIVGLVQLDESERSAMKALMNRNSTQVANLRILLGGIIGKAEKVGFDRASGITDAD